jgi:hypothetical protein
MFGRRITALLGGAILLVGGPVLAGTEAAAAAALHCTASAQAAAQQVSAGVQAEPVCFKSFRDVIAYATAGEVVLPAAATDVSEAQLDLVTAAPSSVTTSTVIGIDYDGSGFTGSTFVWTTTNSAGCSTGISYFADSMPSGWDNRVSSAKGFAGCTTYTHYQDPSYAGATQACTCSSMGFMDNRTSSEQWHP